MNQVATVAWAVAFRVNHFSSYLSLIFHAVVVEWLGFGLLIATACWCVAFSSPQLLSVGYNSLCVVMQVDSQPSLTDPWKVS